MIVEDKFWKQTNPRMKAIVKIEMDSNTCACLTQTIGSLNVALFSVLLSTLKDRASIIIVFMV